MIKNVLLYLIITIAVVVLVGYRINTTSKIESYYKIEAKPTYEEISVGTISSGIVQEVLVKPGDLVKKDTILMRINNTLVSEKYRILLDQNDPVRAVELAELKNRIDNFEIKAPADSIVTQVDVFPLTFVKESDVVLKLVPLNSYSLSFFVNSDVLEMMTPELERQFEVGESVLVKLRGSYEDKFESSITWIAVERDTRTDDLLLRVYIDPKHVLDSSTIFTKTFEIYFQKQTVFRRATNLLTNLINSLN